MRAAEARILVIDDHSTERDVMCAALEEAGYEVVCVVTAAEGRQHVGRYGPPDLVLLAARETSWQAELALCRDVHAGDDTPVIALAAEVLHDRAAMLLVDCVDDFIALPADTGEVLTRVRRCLRRPRRSSQPAEEPGPGEQMVDVDGHFVTLTDREASLVRLLLRHRDRVLSQEYLLQQVWGDVLVNEGTLRVTIHRLRRKIEHAVGRPAHILSVRGRGYVYSTLPTVPSHATQPATVA